MAEILTPVIHLHQQATTVKEAKATLIAATRSRRDRGMKIICLQATITITVTATATRATPTAALVSPFTPRTEEQSNNSPLALVSLDASRR
jgi:hypothetical protein